MNPALDRAAHGALEWYAAFHPETATWMGLHDYDRQVTDVAADSIAAESRMGHALLRAMNAVPSPCTTREELETLALQRWLQGRLFEIDSWQPWKRNPGTVPETLVYGLYLLIARSFAPLSVRRRSVRSRLTDHPVALDTAWAECSQMSRPAAQIALSQMSGSIRFLTDTLPTALELGTEPDARLEDALQKAVDAYQRYAHQLESRLTDLPEEGWRLGAQLFRDALIATEGVSASIDELRHLADSEIERLQVIMNEALSEIDATAPSAQIFAEMVRQHPAADELIQATKSMLSGLVQFIRDADLMSLPDDLYCDVIETPEFMRDLAFATMDPPGPFETGAHEAFYSVTLPPPDAAADMVEGHMRMFNVYNLAMISVHEAFPGHYVQFDAIRRSGSLILKMCESYANIEGWAHYTEEMMVDAGYGNGDPRYRAAMAHEALVRACRMKAALEMHTGDMTVESAIRLFAESAHQETENARVEALRGVVDPLYGNYTLGKLMLMRLRERMRANHQWTDKRFHDEFLQSGAPAIPVLEAVWDAPKAG